MPDGPHDIAAVLDEHLGAESEHHDLERTMATMSPNPCLYHVRQ